MTRCVANAVFGSARLECHADGSHHFEESEMRRWGHGFGGQHPSTIQISHGDRSVRDRRAGMVHAPCLLAAMAGQKRNTTHRRAQLRLVRPTPASGGAPNLHGRVGAVHRLAIALRLTARAIVWATIPTCLVASLRFCLGVFKHEQFYGDQRLSFFVASGCLVVLLFSFGWSAWHRPRRPPLRLVRSPRRAPTPEPTRDRPTGVRRGA